MSFESLRKSVARSHFLSADFFGEEITYHSKSGDARTITAHVRVVQRIEIEESGKETHIEEAVVSCLRDPADTLGGIDRPQLGDAIIRGLVVDPLQHRFVFGGEIRDAQSYRWKLLFIRSRRSGTST